MALAANELRRSGAMNRNARASSRRAFAHRRCWNRSAVMRKALACMMFLGVVFSLPAAADELKFKGGIGVIPVSSGVAVPPTLATAPVVESVNRNIVRGVQPAGQIWVINDLDGKVKGGRITVQGTGLVLGGGNSAGRATGQFVLATLICQAAAPFTASLT